METEAKKIMVIDDEDIAGKMIKATFERDGYIVEKFLNAKPALARFREQYFDVVITDLKMRGVDGMEVLKTIKKESPKTRVIMVTAFANMDTSLKAFSMKADGFFPKPVKISDLKARIKGLLDGEDRPE